MSLRLEYLVPRTSNENGLPSNLIQISIQVQTFCFPFRNVSRTSMAALMERKEPIGAKL